MATNQNPTCPTGCDSVLPVVEFSVCAPETNFGQIKKIYIGNDGYSFTDWTDATEWGTRISNTNVIDFSKIRELTVIGSQAKAEAAEKKISGGRTVRGKKKRTVAFTIDETNQINYDMLRSLECGVAYRMWYATETYMYGGPEGVLVSISMDDIIPESEEEFETFQAEAVWYASYAPERIANPL